MSIQQIKSIMYYVVIAFAVSIAGLKQVHAAEKVIKIDGSSTVYPITEAVAEEFQKATKVRVTVGESGTGGGFKKFCRGETDISDASRPIKQKEMDECKAAGVQYIELPVAYDALTVVVNSKNDWVKSFTVAELNQLWKSGSSVKSWKQINPAYPDTKILMYGPGTASGTFDYFTEAINGKAGNSRSDYTPSEDDNVLVQGVAGDRGATGYFGYAYYEENKDKLRAIPIVVNGKAVEASPENVMNGTYQPLARPLFIYVNATAAAFKPEVKAFVNFYLQHAPKLVKEVKYVPLPADDYAVVTEHFKAMKPGTGFNGTAEVGIKIKDLIKRIKD